MFGDFKMTVKSRASFKELIHSASKENVKISSIRKLIFSRHEYKMEQACERNKDGSVLYKDRYYVNSTYVIRMDINILNNSFAISDIGDISKFSENMFCERTIEYPLPCPDVVQN